MGERDHTVQEQELAGSPGADAPGETPANAADTGSGSAGGESNGGGDRPAPRGAAHDHASEEAGADVQGDIEELVKTAAERDEYLALAQRTQADFDNYRKRVARESANAHERGIASLAKELLPALDNLDRALAEASAAGGPETGEEPGAEEDPLLAGVRLVRSELIAALARAGIESFSPAGEVFNPSVHEAVATVPQPDGGPASGTVVEVYQPGYRLGASVIRPARVAVAA